MSTMFQSPLLRKYFGIVCMVLITFIVHWTNAALAADDDASRTTDGMVVYLGVVPAELVKGHPSGHPERTMHGGSPAGRHQHHLVVAIFDVASGARVSDASVAAQVSGLGLSGSTKTLQPMEIANTITYGGFFDLPGADLYTIRLTIRRSGAERMSTIDFKYDHRR